MVWAQHCSECPKLPLQTCSFTHIAEIISVQDLLREKIKAPKHCKCSAECNETMPLSIAVIITKLQRF